MPSSIRKELDAHQASLLAKISAAAKAGDPRTTLSLTGELQRTTALIARMDDLGSEAVSLLGRGLPLRDTPVPSVSARASVPGRGHGVQVRAAFLDRSTKAGIPLRPYRGAIFQSPKGLRIGVAVATERKPNRWFLGLGEGQFDAAVLLCVPDSGKVIDVCLPASFFAQFGRYLSRSGDQVKFNVARRDAHVVLKIPSKSAERVDGFVGAIARLDP